MFAQNKLGRANLLARVAKRHPKIQSSKQGLSKVNCWLNVRAFVPRTEADTTAVLALLSAQEQPAWQGANLNACDDEGIAENASGKRFTTREDSGAANWADRCAGASEGHVDLREGSAHLWMGPVVAGDAQTSRDTGPRVLRRGGARGRRSNGSEDRGFRQRGNASQLRALPSMPFGAGAHLPESADHRN